MALMVTIGEEQYSFAIDETVVKLNAAKEAVLAALHARGAPKERSSFAELVDDVTEMLEEIGTAFEDAQNLIDHLNGEVSQRPEHLYELMGNDNGEGPLAELLRLLADVWAGTRDRRELESMIRGAQADAGLQGVYLPMSLEAPPR